MSTLTTGPNRGLLSAPASRESENIPSARYVLSVSGRGIPRTTAVMGQVSAFSVVSDDIIRCINYPPVCVTSGIVVKELVIVGAISYNANGGADQVSTGNLMGTDAGCWYERAGREKSLIRLINRRLPCGRGGVTTRAVVAQLDELTRVKPKVERCEVDIQREGELVDGLREPIVGRRASAR